MKVEMTYRMKVEMTYGELSTILAALRHVQGMDQEEREAFGGMDHFVDVDPLTNEEIDGLCEHLNSMSVWMGAVKKTDQLREG